MNNLPEYCISDARQPATEDCDNCCRPTKIVNRDGYLDITGSGTFKVNIDLEIEKLKALFMEAFFPVGYTFITLDRNFNPNQKFTGYWVRESKGRAIVGVDEDDADFNVSGKEIGTKTEKLSVNQLPAHSHGLGEHTHSLASGRASDVVHHNHSINGTAKTGGAHNHSVSGTTQKSGEHSHVLKTMVWSQAGFSRSSPYNNGDHTSSHSCNDAGIHDHSFSGTASSHSGHTHTIEGTSANAGGHGHALTGNTGTAPGNSSSAGGGGVHNNIQPSKTFYIWVRKG